MKRLAQRFRAWRHARRARQVTFAFAQERVRRGAVYLDDVDPGWYRRVHAGTLELACGQFCVLGQLHGGYRTGLSRAQLLNLSSAPRASLSPVHFGFQGVGGVDEAVQARDYAYLNRAWQEAIRVRQQADGPAISVPEAPSHVRRGGAARLAEVV